LAIYYNRNPLEGWFRRCAEKDDGASQAEGWGVRRETYDAWWHTTNNQAVEWLLSAFLTWGAWKYNVTEITAPLNLVHVERGDIVKLTHERSGLEQQVCEVVRTRVEGPGRLGISLAYWDAYAIFSTDQCRVEVDRGGQWMKFYSMGKLYAILYANGDFCFKYTFHMAGTSMLTGNDPSGDDLFVCQLLGGSIYALRVPLPQSAGACWHPMAVIGGVGVVRLFGSKIRMDVANLSETISDYVEWSVGSWVKLAPNGRDVVAKFEQKAGGDPEYPGVWTFKGQLRERNW